MPVDMLFKGYGLSGNVPFLRDQSVIIIRTITEPAVVRCVFKAADQAVEVFIGLQNISQRLHSFLGDAVVVGEAAEAIIAVIR